MQTLPLASSNTPNTLPARTAARPMEDVVYQVVTVGAILMMLGSLWIF